MEDHNLTLYNYFKNRAMRWDIEYLKDSSMSFLSPINLRGIAQITIQQVISEPRT